MDAAGRYRASTGVPFDAFARRRVQGAMLDALRELDWAPRSLRKMRREFDQTLAKLRHELRREPTEEEIAGALNMTSAAYGLALEQLRTLELGAVRPIDDGSGEGGLLDLCSTPTKGPRCACSGRAIRTAPGACDSEAAGARAAHPGDVLQREMTLAEIGQVIGVGESRVSQLRSLAISRLRTSLRETLGLRERAAEWSRPSRRKSSTGPPAYLRTADRVNARDGRWMERAGLEHALVHACSLI